MPFVPSLEFVEKAGAFRVSYRGAAEKQKLVVNVEISGRPGAGLDVLYALRDELKLGFCGGAEFHPTAGAVKLLVEPKDPYGPKFHWEFEVAGLSPRYVRNVIESHVSIYAPVKKMSIVGSLKPDRSKLSVTEDELRAWLEDKETYLEAWPEREFELVEDQLPKGAFVRVHLEGPSDAKILKKFQYTVQTWSAATFMYPVSSLKRERAADPKQIFDEPEVGRTKRALTARFQYMDIAYEPGRDALINGLIWFHHKVARITKAEISL